MAETDAELETVLLQDHLVSQRLSAYKGWSEPAGFLELSTRCLHNPRQLGTVWAQAALKGEL